MRVRSDQTLGNPADTASVHSCDNTNITFARIAERLQSLPIAGTIVGGDSLLDAIELRHSDALSNTLFIGLHCFAPCKEATTMGYDGWPGHLCVCSKRRRVGNRSIE